MHLTRLLDSVFGQVPGQAVRPVVVLPEAPAESGCCGSAPTSVAAAGQVTRPGPNLRRLWQRADKAWLVIGLIPLLLALAGSGAGAACPALRRRRDPAHRHVHRRRGAGGGLVAGEPAPRRC